MHSAIAALGVLVASVAILSIQTSDPEPSPDLSPAEVVRIQIEALGSNDDPTPDAGIEVAFRFASPGNRAATGPLPRFAEMVKGPVYRDMLDFERAIYGESVVEDDLAAQRVTLVHRDGRRSAYVFLLSRQRGGTYAECWMTDGVARHPPPDDGTTRV